VKWYRKAEEQGVAEAQTNLGIAYAAGQGVPEDYAEAMKWWRKAADQNLASAQINLGISYALGQGVPKDDVLEYMWYDLAAEQGVDSAAIARDELAFKMTPAQIAEAQRLAREWKPTK
jgi:TPR repeat protein